MAVAGFAALDFHAFHQDELPRRLQDGNAALAAPALNDLASLAFRLPDGAAYTYVPQPAGVVTGCQR